MRFLPEESPSVAVVGIGYVGTCLAATLASRGLHVTGIDRDVSRVEEMNAARTPLRESGLAESIADSVAAGRLRATTDMSMAAAADVVLVTVGTPILPDGSIDDDQVRAACSALSPHLRRHQLIVFKTTVPPGMTRTMAGLLEHEGLEAGHDFGVAISPERLSEGMAMQELATFPIIVGGLGADSTAAAAAFWKRHLDVPVLEVESLEAAEIVKLADNWWIDVNIALANELAIFCDLHGVDVLDVISAANTIPKGAGKVNILMPSIGVGGSCLTKDPWMIWHSAKRAGTNLQTVVVGREVNSAMPERVAEDLLRVLADQGKEAKDVTIAVLGLAFKNNTGDLRATPVHPAVQIWEKAGATVRLYDPLVDPAEAYHLFEMVPEASLEDAVRGADCVAVLALHREFADVDLAALPVASGCVVLDGRAYYSKERIAGFADAGLTYRGIGR
ncbi:nucleotide sugar dehydrogenase [Aeromicrobium sp. CF3.5]|uniref:nucleotide sugar dehydrogenase n=1 Tax=Aeromicrobium sp. CF3.5 TaxID=3373078 RepID=UPI003EE59854